ncbi:MAG TPA: hypothetical protein VJU61_16995 [Polyangiaceae bacterium]|nr:hypothetical protein [Polyangiaceae bacterium]
MEPREQRKPGGNGGPQAESGGGEAQGQSPVSKAASLAAGAATRQVTKTRERIEDRISEQREHVTSSVRALSRALRGAGEVLEEDHLAAQALHYASDKIESVAGYVAELSPDRAAEDLRGVARSRPWWFYGGAFTLGLALGRFARSSGEKGSSSGTGAGEYAMSRRTSTGGESRTLPRSPEPRSSEPRSPELRSPERKEPRP